MKKVLINFLKEKEKTQRARKAIGHKSSEVFGKIWALKSHQNLATPVPPTCKILPSEFAW